MITDEYRATLETELATLDERRAAIMDRLSEVEFGPLRSDCDGAATVDIFPPDHQAVAFLAESFAKSLGSAANYMSIRMHHPEAGHMEVVIQRVGKMTPAQGRGLAEAEVRRLVDVCKVNGIDEHARIDLAPVKPPDEHADMGHRHGGPDWVLLDFNTVPNVMLCKRCGSRQPMPERITAKIMQAMTAAFEEQHKGCRAP